MVYINPELCVNCGTCIRGCPMGVFVPGENTPQIHPHRRCILCMHCASGCPKKAIRFEELPVSDIYPSEPEDPLEALIGRRRSIRHFKENPPDKKILQDALNIVQHAPSGKNQRAYQWTVVYGIERTRALRDLCLELCAVYGEAPELNKLMAKGTDLLTCGAPVLIVAWSPDDCLNPVLDPAVAMAELELLLVHKGIGTCWGGYLRQVSDRFPEVRQALGLPDDCHVRCALMAGYADRERYQRPVWRPAASITWVSDENDRILS